LLIDKQFKQTANNTFGNLINAI